MDESPTKADAGLRAEHDELARRLEVRRSVEHARRGVVLAVAAFAGLGIGWTLFWERYGKLPTERALAHPRLVPWAAGTFFVVGLALAGWCVAALRRWRRMAREEAGLYARMLELRRRLGIDP